MVSDNFIIRRAQTVLGRIAETDEGIESGFTLLELMVVLLIISILAAIAIPAFMSSVASADDRGAQADLHIALTAAKFIYLNQNASYPTAPGAMITDLDQQATDLQYNSVGSGNPFTVAVEVVVDTGGDTALIMVAKAVDGTCWYVSDSPATVPSHGGTLNPGNWYASAPSGGADCTTDWSGATWSPTWPVS